MTEEKAYDMMANARDKITEATKEMAEVKETLGFSNADIANEICEAVNGATDIEENLIESAI